MSTGTYPGTYVSFSLLVLIHLHIHQHQHQHTTKSRNCNNRSKHLYKRSSVIQSVMLHVARNPNSKPLRLSFGHNYELINPRGGLGTLSSFSGADTKVQQGGRQQNLDILRKELISRPLVLLKNGYDQRFNSWLFFYKLRHDHDGTTRIQLTPTEYPTTTQETSAETTQHQQAPKTITTQDDGISGTHLMASQATVPLPGRNHDRAPPRLDNLPLGAHLHRAMRLWAQGTADVARSPAYRLACSGSFLSMSQLDTPEKVHSLCQLHYFLEALKTAQVGSDTHPC